MLSLREHEAFSTKPRKETSSSAGPSCYRDHARLPRRPFVSSFVLRPALAVMPTYVARCSSSVRTSQYHSCRMLPAPGLSSQARPVGQRRC